MIQHIPTQHPSVLPVPSGYWSIFALLSSADPRPADHEALSWTQRNIVPAVAGALADVHPANCPPPNTHIDDALRHALARLDTDARTGVPWARHASPASTLLAFFDSESRVLRIANTGTGRAFLGRRMGDNHECREIAGSCAVRYLEPVQSRAIDVEELVDEGLFPPRGFLDVASVEVQSVEVRDGDFLVLGSDSTWASLAGDQAVQAVSAWMREQEVSIPERPGRDGRFLEGPLLDVPWKEEQGLVSGLVRAMVPGMIWDIDKMFVGGRGNAASHVLWRTELKHRAEGSSHGAPDQDRPVAGRTRHTTSCSNDGRDVRGWAVKFEKATSWLVDMAVFTSGFRHTNTCDPSFVHFLHTPQVVVPINKGAGVDVASQPKSGNETHTRRRSGYLI
ncbi:hypothetical protein BJV78DRAFT_1151656 [Lactifluus subvellereus]|nr:hypothetical protein BJV78DRAFT_1151656 [Lactifluus subvellereus]